MSEQRRLGPLGKASDGIEDAEFYDVEQHPVAPSAVVTKPPRRRNGCLRAALITCGMLVGAFVMLIVFLAIVGLPPAAQPMIDNNADTAADALDNAADAIDDRANAGDGVSAFTSLLTANDPRVCSDAVAIATVRKRLLPSRNTYALTDDEFARALDLAKVELTEVSASDIRSDVHEISCQANLHFGDGDADVFAINYKVRPAADPDQPPVVYVQAPPLAELYIMSGPISKVESERPSPARAHPAEVDKGSTSEPQHGQGNTSTDETLSAPHA